MLSRTRRVLSRSAGVMGVRGGMGSSGSRGRAGFEGMAATGGMVGVAAGDSVGGWVMVVAGVSAVLFICSGGVTVTGGSGFFPGVASMTTSTALSAAAAIQRPGLFCFSMS